MLSWSGHGGWVECGGREYSNQSASWDCNQCKRQGFNGIWLQMPSGKERLRRTLLCGMQVNHVTIQMVVDSIDGWLPEEWWVDEHLKFDLQQEVG